LTLAAFPAACVLLCAARVPPVHGWMMRHHCPIATWTMKQPSHPMETDGSAMVRAR
jgi:hypothetical protein